MLAMIKANERLACYSVSRLSRSVADLYTVLQQLEEHGVGFVSATEPIETATPMGKAFLGILAVLAQLEREQTSQHVTVLRLLSTCSSK